MHKDFSYSFLPVPTLQRFVQDNSFIRLVVGPVGSGKSSVCCVEIVRRACLQEPDKDGIRKTRWAVIRNTAPQLRDTTIPTFIGSEDGKSDGWFPPRFYGRYKKTDNEFIMDFALPDGSRVISEVLFRALDRPDQIRNLLSMELTGAWINEAREINKAVFEAIQGRVGRYPPSSTGGTSWHGIIMDTNPPDTDHWIFRIFEKNRPQNYAIYHQPSGRGPEAENLINLPRDYYSNLAIGKDEGYIKVYIDGEYGFVQDGRPVYPSYSDSINLSKKTLYALKGLPIRLGWDFGLTPACVVTQLTPKGQFIILREYVATEMGIRRLAREIVKPALMNEFRENPVISVGDLAGNQRTPTDERTCFQELNDAGIPTEMAKTNDTVRRVGSVEAFLSRRTLDGPGLIMDPSCHMLRAGFLGKYRYRRVRISGDERFTDKPDKNEYSHPHDALQYAAMDCDYQILKGEKTRMTGQPKPEPPPSALAWT